MGWRNQPRQLRTYCKILRNIGKPYQRCHSSVYGRCVRAAVAVAASCNLGPLSCTLLLVVFFCREHRTRTEIVTALATITAASVTCRAICIVLEFLGFTLGSCLTLPRQALVHGASLIFLHTYIGCRRGPPFVEAIFHAAQEASWAFMRICTARLLWLHQMPG